MPTVSSALPLTTPFRRDASVIGLVGLGHGISHFCQLLLPPLFPWLKGAFSVSYVQLGFLLTIFFFVSCAAQLVSGFWVDRFGPRPVLFAGLGMLGLAALGYAASTRYEMLALVAVVHGIGNGVFHPADYTLLNRKVDKTRLGHAYSVHGITGSLGWALAPAMLVPITLLSSWRVALVCAALLVFAVMALLWFKRSLFELPLASKGPAQAAGQSAESSFAFLRIPAVWMCFGFFLFYAGVISIVQSFAPEAARQLHHVPIQLAALCLTIYMLCSAGGMVCGGFLVSDLPRSERIVGSAFGVAATVALAIGLVPIPALLVPALFGAMGFVLGLAGPSRDLIIKSAAPDNASGRVYGVVYAGLDIGQALAPLVVGTLMDHHAWRAVWFTMALLQAVLIVSAFNVRRVRRTGPQAAPA